jgi:hypothetical protein
MCKLPTVDAMFEAVHLLIKTIRSSKGLKRAYKTQCEALKVNAALKIAPDHRFGYRVIEAACVKAALRPLTMLFSDNSVLRQNRDVAGLDACAQLIMGTKLLGEGANQFKLSELLDVCVTTLQLLTNAIEKLEADKPMASMALPLWFKIIDTMAPLGADLQRSLRGRGSAAATARTDFITEFLTTRRQQYSTPELIAATLLDPANALEDPDGIWRPNKDWFSPEEISTAAKAVERIAGAVGAGTGPAARLQFMSLLADGFDADAIALCRTPEGQWINVQQRRLVWETEIVHSHPQLAPIAGRLMSQHTTSCSVERSWARWGKLFNPQRSSMRAATAQHYMFIANAWHLQHRPAADVMLPEEAFWMQQHPSDSDTDSE